MPWLLQAVNFFSYDMYRKLLLRLSGNQNKPNRAERFVAGALAGLSSLCASSTRAAAVMLTCRAMLGCVLDDTFATCAMFNPPHTASHIVSWPWTMLL